jgi:phosphopantothenoylcysteine synthetase/decarboxylase
MKLKTRLLTCTAVLALSAGVAFAAIDGNRLAKDYLEEGYTWVEVKVGPTQTKVEAVKDGRKVEVIYDNATGDIITQENETADDDDLGRTGMQVKTVKKDFEDDEDDDDEDDDEDDDDEDHDDDHDSDHDDDSDDADDN